MKIKNILITLVLLTVLFVGCAKNEVIPPKVTTPEVTTPTINYSPQLLIPQRLLKRL